MNTDELTKWIAKRDLAAMESTLANLRNALKAAEALRDSGEGWDLYERLEEMAGQVERMMVEQQGHLASLG